MYSRPERERVLRKPKQGREEGDVCTLGRGGWSSECNCG